LLTAKQGLGIAMASTMSARQALRAGELQRVLPGYEFAPAEVYAYHAVAGARSATVRLLLDFLVVELGNADLGLAPATGEA
jgi:DNA-binding transcriptional LysR family regulator